VSTVSRRSAALRLCIQLVAATVVAILLGFPPRCHAADEGQGAVPPSAGSAENAESESASGSSPNAAENETAAPPGAVPSAAASVNRGDPATKASQPVPPESSGQSKSINIFWLLVQGGWFMVPILFVSLMVVTFAIERGIGLRQSRLLPPDLVEELGELGMAPGGFDPRHAYRVCQQHPSAAANVVRAMLLKVGRPHSEVEHTVAETSEREANRVYSNVRWINLGTSVAPLLGLLGTVWGMIVCFHDTTQLDPGQNKAEFLANGIYIALVTTLAGLCVAIPAAVIAHYLEGKIQSAFHQIDELVFNLLPQIERFEGRIRFSRQSGSSTSRTDGDDDGDGDGAGIGGAPVGDGILDEPPVQKRSSSRQ
jgi:biopolymer transport protein ExbB